MQVADTRHQGKTIGRKEARKIFESVLKASKTGAKGTHVRALMNPMSSTYDDKFPAAWAQLTKDEQKEVIRKQDQQIATVKALNMATKTQKKQEQLVKRAKKKFDAIDTDGSGDITLDEMKAAMLGHEYVGSFGARDVTMHDVIRRFNDMDVNKDGAISLTEFQAGLARESQVCLCLRPAPSSSTGGSVVCFYVCVCVCACVWDTHTHTHTHTHRRWRKASGAHSMQRT